MCRRLVPGIPIKTFVDVCQSLYYVVVTAVSRWYDPRYMFRTLLWLLWLLLLLLVLLYVLVVSKRDYAGGDAIAAAALILDVGDSWWLLLLLLLLLLPQL